MSECLKWALFETLFHSNASIIRLTDVLFYQKMLQSLLKTNEIAPYDLPISLWKLVSNYAQFIEHLLVLGPEMLSILSIFPIYTQFIECLPHCRSIY